MSLVDNTSEAGPSDLLEANDDDMSMSDPACVIGAEAVSNTNLNCLSTPLTSPYPTSPLYERPVSDDRSTPFSERYCTIRRARSTARAPAHISFLRGNGDRRSFAARRCSPMTTPTIPLSLLLSQAPFSPRLTSLCPACTQVWLQRSQRYTSQPRPTTRTVPPEKVIPRSRYRAP
jgi:hypothetical protein